MEFADSLIITVAGLFSLVIVFRAAQWVWDILVDKFKAGGLDEK
jgi:hypothetical protein